LSLAAHVTVIGASSVFAVAVVSLGMIDPCLSTMSTAVGYHPRLDPSGHSAPSYIF